MINIFFLPGKQRSTAELNKELRDVCQQLDCQGINRLLKQGANLSVSMQTASKNTCLDYLIVSPQFSLDCIAEALQAYGKDEQTRLLASRNRDGQTPLMLAIKHGEVRESIQLLIDLGSDVNATDNRGKTALHLAVKREDVEIVKLLIAAGANVNVQGTGDRQSPLHLAVSQENVEITVALFQAGANPFVRNRRGDTPLALAQRSKNAELRRLAATVPAWECGNDCE